MKNCGDSNIRDIYFEAFTILRLGASVLGSNLGDDGIIDDNISIHDWIVTNYFQLFSNYQKSIMKLVVCLICNMFQDTLKNVMSSTIM